MIGVNMRVQLTKFCVGIVFALVSCTTLLAQDPQFGRQFDYDKNAPLDLKILGSN